MAKFSQQTRFDILTKDEKANVNELARYQTKLAIMGKALDPEDAEAVSTFRQSIVEKETNQIVKGLGDTKQAMRTTGLAFKKLGGALLAPFKALGAFLLSPAGLIMIFAAVIGLIKKITSDVNTQNETVARLQIVFDKFGRRIKEIFESLKKVFGPVLDGLAKAFKPLLESVFGKGIFDLSMTERAAAGFVVLSNKIKEMSVELRESKRDLDALTAALNTFSGLSSRFSLTSAEQSLLAESEQSIRNRLATDYGVDTNASGEALVEIVRSTIRQEGDRLEGLDQRIKKEIGDYFDRNPLAGFNDFIQDADLSESLKEQIENLPAILQEVVKQMSWGGKT